MFVFIIHIVILNKVSGDASYQLRGIPLRFPHNPIHLSCAHVSTLRAASIMNGLSFAKILPKLLTVNRFVLGKMGLFATTRQGSHVGLKANYQ